MYRYFTWLVLLCAALALLWTSAARADYVAGRTAWEAGRYAEALKQWQEAARKSDRRAMVALARAFVKGLGVPQDFIEAHKWFNLAAARGDAKAAAERDALAKRMTLEEQAEARKLARAWRSTGRRRVTAIPPRRKAPRAASPPRRMVRKSSAGRAARASAALRAASAGDVSALDKALATGADPNGRGRRGWTPLMYAANKGYTLLVPPLLAAGAKPNLRAADGATALFIAALHGHSELVDILVKAGADPTIKGPKGRTAMDVALKKGVSPAVFALLVFRDCPECPEMVPVPAGSFVMGSNESSDEKSRLRVTIAISFMAGKYEVTFSEWDACVAAGGCGGYRPGDHGWGRGRRPVINVSWDDAKAYVRWLSAKTEKRYRLLSEAEWEYAARAGTTSRFSWGDDIGRNRANCEGCGSHWDNKRTAPVGSFLANSFALHEVHGNVWEWVADCWNENYRGALADGSARMSGDCSYRVLRGGSWINASHDLRSANRIRSRTGDRDNFLGFRVARTLAP